MEVKDSTSARMLYTRYEYDKLGRLTGVYENNTGTSETQIAEYDYGKDGSNNPTMTVTYNQVTGGSRAYVSDALGRIKLITNAAGGSSVSEFDYATNGSTDGLGRKTHAREMLETGSGQLSYDVYYTYDKLGRMYDYDLKEYPSQDLVHDDNYTFDAVGNRLTNDDGSCTYQNAQETYGVSGAINSDILASDPNYYYYYDKNGSLTKRTLKTDATTYTEYHYDYDQRLVQVKKYVSSSLNQTITYTYDPMGNLIKKTDGATTTTYVQDINSGLPQILIEDDGATVAKYTYGADRLKVSRSGDYYYFYDGLGSTRTITNTSGTVICRYVYDVYGKPLASECNEAQTWNNFKFTGELYDEDTELIYLRARWYDPATSRFLTRDKVADKDYKYCSNDPVNRIDSTGCCSYNMYVTNVALYMTLKGLTTIRRAGFVVQLIMNEALPAGTILLSNGIIGSNARLIIHELSEEILRKSEIGILRAVSNSIMNSHGLALRAHLVKVSPQNYREIYCSYYNIASKEVLRTLRLVLHHRIPQTFREVLGTSLVDNVGNLVALPEDFHMRFINELWNSLTRKYGGPDKVPADAFMEKLREVDEYIKRVEVSPDEIIQRYANSIKGVD